MQEFIQAQFVPYIPYSKDICSVLCNCITKISVGYMSINRLYLSVISNVIFQKVL